MAKGYFQIFNEYITKEIKELGTTYTSHYADVMVSFSSSSIVIYIIYVGYQHMAGKRQAPISDLVWDMTKFSILLTFIQNTGGWLDLVSQAAQGLKEGFSGGSIWRGLDEIAVISNELSETVKQMDESWVGINGWFAGVLILIGVSVLSLVSSLTLLIADITMQFMLLTAPIFIFCLMWGWLRQMFNNWLQIIFSSILTVLFVSLVVDLNISYMTSLITFVTKESNSNTGIYLIAFSVLCSGVMGAVLVVTAKAMASSIASVGVEAAVQSIAIAGAKNALRGGASAARLGKTALPHLQKGASLAGKGAMKMASKARNVSRSVVNKLRAKS